jgi:hypothetical protein
MAKIDFFPASREIPDFSVHAAREIANRRSHGYIADV